MSRRFANVVAAVLVPCLAVDPAMAAALQIPHATVRETGGLFASQALALPAADPINPENNTARLIISEGAKLGPGAGAARASDQRSPEWPTDNLITTPIETYRSQDLEALVSEESAKQLSRTAAGLVVEATPGQGPARIQALKYGSFSH